MTPILPIASAKPAAASGRRLERGGQVLGSLSGFQALPPRFCTPQDDLLAWLAEAHAVQGGAERSTMETLFARYGASSERIAARGHDLRDFTHRDWRRMRLFGPSGSDITQKTAFFNEAALEAFERFYPADRQAPDGLVHVTCTGYSAPSAAQRLVSMRGWGGTTQVLHAYHMGCCAAHPALRMAAGQQAAVGHPDAAVDIVHTELCSLHLDVKDHSPAALVIQSLFADGCIRYQLHGPDHPGASPSLEILAVRDEVLPDSLDAMRWEPGPLAFSMELSKEVPTRLAGALPGFVRWLFAAAGRSWEEDQSRAVAAIHPGGPRIIDLSTKILGLTESQSGWSRQVLLERGNMSSATLPHIWQRIVEDLRIPDATPILSLAAGPGLTLSGAVLRLRR